MGLLYGRAGRLTAKNGGFRPGQWLEEKDKLIGGRDKLQATNADIVSLQVRKAPSWPRSWANFSPSQLCSHRNAWANLHLLGQPDTFLARVRRGLGRGLARRGLG